MGSAVQTPLSAHGLNGESLDQTFSSPALWDTCKNSLKYSEKGQRGNLWKKLRQTAKINAMKFMKKDTDCENKCHEIYEKGQTAKINAMKFMKKDTLWK